MAVYDQQVTTYSDTTAHQRVISDIIQIIDPRDTPLIAALGGLDSARSKFKVRENGYKIELLEDALPPLSTTITNGASGTVALTTDTLSFTVTDASMFQEGHVVKVDSELMVISAVSTANNTVTVSARDYGGTNATHDGTSAIEIVGMARLEGAEADFGPIVDITAPYNYTSIFQMGLNISGTQQVLSQHGISDEYEYQAMKAIPHLLRLVEKQIFNGIRAAGTATTPRSFGGLGTFITANSVNAGGGIAKSDLDNAMEYAFLDGGAPDIIVMNPSVARDLKDVTDSSSYVSLSYENTQIGMQPVKRVVTQYGELQIVMDRWCPLALSYLIDSRKVGLYTLRPFQWHELAVVGDSKRGEVIGEFSLLVANTDAHAYIYGITS